MFIKDLTLAKKNYNIFSSYCSLLNYCCVIVFFFSCTALKVSAARLILSDNLVLRDIDDKAVEHGFLSNKQTIDLTQGEHTLVIKYKDVFEDVDFGEEKLIKSDYFVVKFLIKEQELLFLTTSDINGLDEAERFVNSPELILTDENREEIKLDLEDLANYTLNKKITSVVSSLLIPADAPKYNDKTQVINKKDNVLHDRVISHVNNEAVPMLKYWWQQASKDQQATFIRFVNDKKHQK